MAKKIYLSPSNQSGNTYAAGKTNECEQCNRIAEYLEKALLRCGFAVKRAPKGQDMNKSIRESNEWGTDVHIPIHTNAGGGKGPLVMVYAMKDQNTKFASPVYNELKTISPKGGGYGVRVGSDMTAGHYMPSELSDTAATAIYCECDFHDDKTIAQWIIDNVKLIAEAICKGVCAGASVKYIEEPTTPGFIYRVQIGAYSVKANADAQLDKVKKAGFTDAFIAMEKAK